MEPNTGDIFVSNSGRLLGLSVFDGFALATFIQTKGPRHVWLLFTVELLNIFCEGIGHVEFIKNEKARDRIAHLPIYIKEGELEGRWEQVFDGAPIVVRVTEIVFCKEIN